MHAQTFFKSFCFTHIPPISHCGVHSSGNDVSVIKVMDVFKFVDEFKDVSNGVDMSTLEAINVDAVEICKTSSSFDFVKPILWRSGGLVPRIHILGGGVKFNGFIVEVVSITNSLLELFNVLFNIDI